MSLTPGAQIGPYEIVSSLGAGGMGEVWRARDSRLGRDVAIKVLHGSVASDPERRDRFEREARAIAALSHPHILAIFDIGEHEGQLYVVTELLEGQTLRERLADGPLPFRKVIDIGVQVAKGLTAAHERGIIHRDLKPENLFCTKDGLTKILDFGLARQVTPTDGSGATETVAATDPGTILGTVGYMAPEQVRSQAVDARTDLFALGAVLYEAACGNRAFRGDTAADTISAILREDPPDITTSRSDFSPAFDRIVRHCLEKAPEDRFQTARDVAFALTALSGSASSLASGEAVLPPAPRTKRFPIVPAAAALLVLASVAGVAIGRWTAPVPSSWVFEPKTLVEQTIFSSRFMPDGETVIISAAMSGTTPSLYEARAGSSTPRQFGLPGTHLLSISRAGELLVIANAQYVGQRQMRGTLARMAVDGTPRAIAEDIREAEWLPDGSDFVAVRDRGRTDVLEFPVGTPVHTVDGYISTPRVSPDGTLVAFMEHPQKWDNRGFVKIVDRAGTVTTLTGDYPGEEGVAWSADGREVLFAAQVDGEYQIHAVPADGHREPRIWLSTAGTVYLDDSRPDGGLLLSLSSTYYGVGGRASRDEAERDLSPSDLAWSPSLSADGKTVLMTDGHGSNDYSVVIRPMDGSPATRLGDGQSGNLSADGQWATALLFSTGKCVVYPTGAGAPVGIDTGEGRCTGATFIEPGHQLLVQHLGPDGQGRTLTMAFPDGALEPAIRPPGLAGVVATSRTGRTFGRDEDGQWVVVSPDGSITRARGYTDDDRFMEWTDDDRWMTVASGTSPTRIFRVDWRTGTRTQIDEVAAGGRPGLLTYQIAGYRADTGAYVMESFRRTSALFVASRQ